MAPEFGNRFPRGSTAVAATPRWKAEPRLALRPNVFLQFAPHPRRRASRVESSRRHKHTRPRGGRQGARQAAVRVKGKGAVRFSCPGAKGPAGMVPPSRARGARRQGGVLDLRNTTWRPAAACLLPPGCRACRFDWPVCSVSLPRPPRCHRAGRSARRASWQARRQVHGTGPPERTSCESPARVLQDTRELVNWFGRGFCNIDAEPVVARRRRLASACCCCRLENLTRGV